MPIPGEERTPDNQELNEEVSDQEEEEGGGSESDVVQEPASRLKGDSEGEESHGEDEVREEGDSEEEGWSSSDDEDIHQLVQTLQSYVEESSMSHFDQYYFDITMCTDTVFNYHRISSTYIFYSTSSFTWSEGNLPSTSHGGVGRVR